MSEIPHDLDAVFEALANAHRREIIYLLGLQPYAIHQLAEIRGLSLPAMHKHIKLLENAAWEVGQTSEQGNSLQALEADPMREEPSSFKRTEESF